VQPKLALLLEELTSLEQTPQHRRCSDAVKVSIGGVCIGLSFATDSRFIYWDPTFHKFLSNSEPHINIRVHYVTPPQATLRPEHLLFDSQKTWRLYRTPRGESLIMNNVLVLLNNSDSITIFDGRQINDVWRTGLMDSAQEFGGRIFPQPLDLALGQVLMVWILAHGRGLMLHACGIDDGGKGYLFCGHSGHGKSTMAKLWREKARVLNEERIILRLVDGNFWIYGVPWHGQSLENSSQGAPLEKVFILGRGQSNEATLCRGGNACGMILSRSFPPLWDGNGMLFTLELASQLTQVIKVFDLRFKPDEDIVTFVRCLK
jgi:hypothetical protein